MIKDKSRIQSCVDHINTAVDVDPWAKELVVEMGKEVLNQLNNSNNQLNNSNDCISKQGAIDICNIVIDLWQGQLGEGALVAIKNAINNLPFVQPEPSEMTDEQAILHLQSTGWMQNHDREMYESGLRERLADDSGGYDSLIPCDDAISRQDAIRWVKTECNPYGRPTLDFESGKWVIEHLKQMPSVQPTYTDAEIQKMQDMHQVEVEKAFDLGREDTQSEITHCKDCKYWMPYDWMFSEVWQSKNMDDYPEDEIGCTYCDMNMGANDFCSRSERRTDEHIN